MRKLLIVLLLTASAWGGGLPEWKANPVSDGSEDSFGGCSLACAADWTVSASSHLSPQGKNRYDAQQTNDGKLGTCWSEGSDGTGNGEWLEFRFDDLHQENLAVDGFLIANGYHKSNQAWFDNGRVAQLWLELNGEPQCVLELLDTRQVQRVKFPAIAIHKGDRLRLRITRVYPGTRYPDTCLSEVLPEGQHTH
ncbi:MAG: hypothetical protein AB1758_18230 [Candidatus Eremiobacterota bacterium]